jgi:hypothetical protein
MRQRNRSPSRRHTSQPAHNPHTDRAHTHAPETAIPMPQAPSPSTTLTETKQQEEEEEEKKNPTQHKQQRGRGYVTGPQHAPGSLMLGGSSAGTEHTRRSPDRISKRMNTPGAKPRVAITRPEDALSGDSGLVNESEDGYRTRSFCRAGGGGGVGSWRRGDERRGRRGKWE